MKSVLWIMKKIFKYCWKYVFLLGFVFLISSLIQVSVSFLNKLVVNELLINIGENKLSVIFIFLLISYLLAWLISLLIGYLHAFANNLFRLKIDVFIQKIFMRKSSEFQQEKFLDTDFMDKYSYINNNIYKANVFIFKLFSILFSNITIIGSSTIVFMKYEPLLIIYSIAVFIAQCISTVITSNIQYNLSKSQSHEERASKYFSDLFINKSAAKEMRIFDFCSKMLSKWKNINNIYIHKQVKVDNQQYLISTILNMLNIIIRFSCIFILLFGIKNNKYDIGTFVMLFSLSETCMNNIKDLTAMIFSGIFNDMKFFNDYYEFIYPLSDKEINEIIRNPESKNSELYVGDFRSLSVKNLSFKYPNSDKVILDNINLSINKGEIVCILGFNGSGKTTLSKLLNGSYTPISGLIRINETDISEIPKFQYFKYWGIAPQEYSKFSISIRDTVGLGFIEKYNDENSVIDAYNKTDLYTFINKYEYKDDTIIGKEYCSDGIDISGGEMQRLIIASAYMGDHEILIMDEPTASIDPLKEVEMLNSIRENLKDKTAILISHRIGFARLADRIIMLCDGKILEQGTHEELISKKGLYSEMFELQKELYN